MNRRLGALGIQFLPLIALCLFAASCANPSGGGRGEYGGPPPPFALPDTTEGEFTLTGADEYEGKYAVLIGVTGEGTLYGFDGASSADALEGVKIDGGTVTLPVYFIDDANPGAGFKGYSGDDTVTDLVVVLLDGPEFDYAGYRANPEEYETLLFPSLDFSGGGVSVSGGSFLSGIDGEDFGGPPAVVAGRFKVHSAEDWEAAVAAIREGGDGKNYVVILTGDLSVSGSTEPTFGGVSDVTVSLRGNKTLSLGPDNGNVLRLGAGQALVLRESALMGRKNNYYAPLVYIEGGSVTMTGGEISGNNRDGVYVDSGSFTMKAGEISGNIRGVYAGSGGSFTMTGGKISGNSHTSGGGVYIDGGSFTMSGGEISDNHAVGGGGVGIMSGSFEMTGGEISKNSGSGQGGGGVCIWDGSFTMKGGKISGNSVLFFPSTGGGVVVNGGSFTMSGGEISGNTVGNLSSNSSYGGGVGVINGSFTMTNGEISGNSAIYSGSGYGAYGGGVYVRDSVSFDKSGGVINGKTGGDPENDNPADNTTTQGDTFGHAVYYDASPGYYRDGNLNKDDDISTAVLPENSGGTLGNWTKK